MPNAKVEPARPSVVLRAMAVPRPTTTCTSSARFIVNLVALGVLPLDKKYSWATAMLSVRLRWTAVQ